MTTQLKLTSRSSVRSETLMAIGALLVALVFYTFLPILIKICESEISPNATIFNRLWIATAVLGLWNGLLSLRKPVQLLPKNRHNFCLLLLMGVFFGGQQLLYAQSLTQTSVANSEVLHGLTPLFTTLLGWMLLSQKFDRKYLLGIAIAIVGSLALAANDFSIASDKLQGDGLALVSAALWGGYLLVTEQLQTKLSITAITTWNCGLSTLFVLPLFLLGNNQLFPHSAIGWLTVATLGIGIIFTSSLITYSFKRLSSGLVATILLVHPAISAILAWGIFSESLNLFNLLGFFIILVGIYLTVSAKGSVKASEG